MKIEIWGTFKKPTRYFPAMYLVNNPMRLGGGDFSEMSMFFVEASPGATMPSVAITCIYVYVCMYAFFISVFNFKPFNI